MNVSTRLSLAEYSLYSGFVVLTLLQVLRLEMVTGPLFQALCLNKLENANLEDHRLWAGHDTLNLLFCFRTLLLWLYDSDHLCVGYLSRSRNMWLIRILRDA